MRPLLAVLLATAAPALAATDDAHPVLFKADALAAMGNAKGAPLYDAEFARVRKDVDAAIARGVVVPVPKDPAGGFTHDQHQRNYKAIYGAGLLYRITGEKRYADHVRDVLLAYAKLYPTLGPHPAKANEAAGRLFWQSLNDAVWLTYAVQGYDAVRDTLTPADRQRIDDEVFRRMARFLSQDDAATFDRIHNHATWSCAGVGMTGYVLRDQHLIDIALHGRAGKDQTGFLAQVDQLFSPDGYYNEGPYYQRYAIQPFVLFAHAIDANDPAQGIFKRRDGVLLKAIRTGIQLTYNGRFIPVNDALPEKSLKTQELYEAVAVGYGATRDPGLLSIARYQDRVTLTPEGAQVARDLAAGKATPFAFPSMAYRDGANGDQGALALMRDHDELVVAKNSAMGMGHGHFDKLNFLLFDNGRPIVTDYGAARFLNIEAKDGGRYLTENESWGKQTVAHNTLVVNETSDFAGQWRVGEKHPPKQIYFSGDGPTRISIGEMADAWPGVTFRRALVQVPLPGNAPPVVLDLLRVTGAKPATYDLPLHYLGQIMEVGFPLQQHVAERPVLGKANGYQHIWVDATGAPTDGKASFTWLDGERFYSWRALLPTGADIVLGESGANDPRHNLRREPMLIARATGHADADFLSVIEPHGGVDESEEVVAQSHSRIAALRHARGDGADAIAIDLAGGGSVLVGIADDPAPAARHSVTLDGRTLGWTGAFVRQEIAK